jgi:hypothetical protein
MHVPYLCLGTARQGTQHFEKDIVFPYVTYVRSRCHTDGCRIPMMSHSVWQNFRLEIVESGVALLTRNQAIFTIIRIRVVAATTMDGSQ